jgi:dihydropteroate synthase
VPFELRAGRPLPGATRDGDGWTLHWSAPAVMGIVNVTPDSFSDGGLFLDSDRAVAHGRELAAQGALVVDVGGESTRPGAEPVPDAVEIDRVRPVVAALAADGVLVSVDTRWAEVAAAAIDAGAHLVNDVSGLGDPEMAAVCARSGTPVVIGHMQGAPATMQNDPSYDDVVAEVSAALRAGAAAAEAAGVPSTLVDPGLGFGKTTEHNLALLGAMPLDVDRPVVIGASRKGFIGQLGGGVPPAQRDAGTIAVHLFAAQRGAALVRAHDVVAHVQALALDRALREGVPSAPSDEDRVAELELALLQPAVRADRPRLEALLHPDFAEVGASGRRWTRAELIAELVAAEPVEPAEAGDLATARIADDVILTTFTTRRGGRTVRRSSVWVRHGGGWMVRLHHGTPAADT